MTPREWMPCRLCGGTADDLHHVFGAANRKISTQYGMVEWLCRTCHDNIASSAGGKLLKMAHQAKFEETHTREEFMQIFGRSWL